MVQQKAPREAWIWEEAGEVFYRLSGDAHETSHSLAGIRQRLEAQGMQVHEASGLDGQILADMLEGAAEACDEADFKVMCGEGPDPFRFVHLLQDLGPTQLRVLVARLVDMLRMPTENDRLEVVRREVENIKQTPLDSPGKLSVLRLRGFCHSCKERIFPGFKWGVDPCPHCGEDPEAP